jgi:hypothetical protein
LTDALTTNQLAARPVQSLTFYLKVSAGSPSAINPNQAFALNAYLATFDATEHATSKTHNVFTTMPVSVFPA